MSADDARRATPRASGGWGGAPLLWARWVELWDEREPATSLALIRISLATVVLVDLGIAAGHGVVTWLWAPPAGGGITSWDPAEASLFQRIFSGTAGAEWWLWGGLVASALCVGIGCFTRVAALGYVCLSTQAALINAPADRAIDRMIRIVFLILVLSPAGSAWSLDAKRASGSFRGAGGVAPAWARYLILGQLVLVYFGAGLAKGGTYWYPWGGYSALYLTLSDPIMSAVDRRWFEQPLAYASTQLATALTHLWELAAPLVLVAAHYRRTQDRPGRLRRLFNRIPVRDIYVVSGVAFHLSLALVLRLGIFPFAMLACFPAFFRPQEIERGIGSTEVLGRPRGAGVFRATLRRPAR
jgi:hypothetical protein